MNHLKCEKLIQLKEIYNLKKINKIRLNETYVKNRLKCFKILKMQIENVKEKKST